MSDLETRLKTLHASIREIGDWRGDDLIQAWADDLGETVTLLRAAHGTVETAYRAWIASIEAALTLRQLAAVEQLYALARMLDAAPGEPLSAKTAASRELRQVANELRDAGAVGGMKPVAEDQPVPDGVSDIQAERRRRQNSA